MTNQPIALIRELRQRTQAGLNLIREALHASNDDLAAAEKYVRERWKPPRARETGAGLIVTGTHQGRIGAMLEVRCGTDFVTRTDEFQTLCRELVLQVLAGCGEEPFEEQDHVRDPSRKVRDLIDECARKVGETIVVARHVRWET